MTKRMIAALGGLALMVSGTGYAAQHEAPKSEAAPPAAESMKAEQASPAPQAPKREAKPKVKKKAAGKCPKGQVYSKKYEKCVIKAARAGESAK